VLYFGRALNSKYDAILMLFLSAGWFGNTETNKNRRLLPKLAAQYPQYFDVHDHYVISGNYLSLPDLVKRYKYVIDMEGTVEFGLLFCSFCFGDDTDPKLA
jgi:hypothetical protein